MLVAVILAAAPTLAIAIDTVSDYLIRRAARIESERTPPDAEAVLARMAISMKNMGLRMEVPGIRDPILQPASEAVPNEDMEVLGVTVEGHARAYSVQALSRGPTSHVVNDVIAGIPVSVTFCDMTHCARVFTKSGSSAALDLAVGGLRQGKMVLLVDGREFVQDDDGIPLDDVPHEQMTWTEWKTTHPDSEVYLGGSAASDSVPAD